MNFLRLYLVSLPCLLDHISMFAFNFNLSKVFKTILVEMSQRHGWHLSVLAVVLELELEHVLLDLRVPERLQYPSSVGAQEVVAHVGVEVKVVKVVDKISLLCCMFELLVVVTVNS